MNVTVRRGLTAAVVACAAPLMAGCGVNFNAQTDQPYNPTGGVDVRTSQIDVLNTMVVAAHKGTGTVVSTLVNNNQRKDDKLVSVSGAGADGNAKVTVTGPTVIPAGGMLNLADYAGITITSPRVDPGLFVTLRFTFANADPVTVGVPVMVNKGAYANVQVPAPATPSTSPSGKPSGGPSGKPSTSASKSPSAKPSKG